MVTNLYGPHPFMISSGQFWRCRHGHTDAIPCWKCGLFHPICFVTHLYRTLT